MQIHELTLVSNDPAGQFRFWAGTLGLPVRHGAEGAVEVSLRTSMIRFERAPAGTDARYHFAINVPYGSIHDAAAWITDRHELLAFHGDPDEEEGATIVHTDRGAYALYFLDAGGNVVELIGNDHLDNGCDAPFGPDSLLEIAEIGLATADTDGSRLGPGRPSGEAVANNHRGSGPQTRGRDAPRGAVSHPRRRRSVMAAPGQAQGQPSR